MAGGWSEASWLCPASGELASEGNMRRSRPLGYHARQYRRDVVPDVYTPLEAGL
jgi:hypothetical protein